MRKIIFRGKRIDNGRWVLGYYVFNPQEEIHEIYSIRHHASGVEFIVTFNVNKETIGQYIGFKDKNGKKIFEGDILKFRDQIGVLFYNEKFAKFMFQPNNSIASYPIDYTCDFKIIGNIHDNPELLEGE